MIVNVCHVLQLYVFLVLAWCRAVLPGWGVPAAVSPLKKIVNHWYNPPHSPRAVLIQSEHKGWQNHSLNCYCLVDAIELWAPERPDTETVSSLRPSTSLTVKCSPHCAIKHVQYPTIHTYIYYSYVLKMWKYLMKQGMSVYSSLNMWRTWTHFIWGFVDEQSLNVNAMFALSIKASNLYLAYVCVVCCIWELLIISFKCLHFMISGTHLD